MDQKTQKSSKKGDITQFDIKYIYHWASYFKNNNLFVDKCSTAALTVFLQRRRFRVTIAWLDT